MGHATAPTCSIFIATSARLTLNLKERDGREIFMRLVKGADVVVENFRPDVKDRMGIALRSTQAVNPRIILASISGFGQSGPLSHARGF